ncbi:hypothetical protein [Rhizohabitans arisaemae]|uniref:hypothetical protein n=1 Tax=Rhizohabitans arisaemae TaxID=2720610 RepID=UPI0024B2089B|nr:hypothetical protein [Rhizohabitans arisaemae]
MTEELRYINPWGMWVDAKVTPRGEAFALPGLPLRARPLWLESEAEGDCEVLQITVGDQDRRRAYDLLDNEILAGLRLVWLVGSGPYPDGLSRLRGYVHDTPEPFALVHRYRGDPVGAHASQLLTADRRAFQVSLMTALRWLAAAGIAHRGISPDTVRWDHTSIQITNFALATIVGTPRTVAGHPPWAAPEQRSGPLVRGVVTDRDDVWAAGRLLYYTWTQEELTSRDQLARAPELVELLAGVFDAPENRPTARELLVERLRVPDCVPRGLDADPLAEGRESFHSYRRRKHPEVDPPVRPLARPIVTPQPPAPVRRVWPWMFGVVLVLAVVIYLVSR